MTDKGSGVPELKNIAVEPAFQGKEYGKSLLDFLVRPYVGRYAMLRVGTEDSPSIIAKMLLMRIVSNLSCLFSKLLICFPHL